MRDACEWVMGGGRAHLFTRIRPVRCTDQSRPRRAGNDDFGRLGSNSTSDQLTPVAVLAPAGVTTWTQVSAGVYHTCGLSSNGSAYCFGACPAAGLLAAEVAGLVLPNSRLCPWRVGSGSYRAPRRVTRLGATAASRAGSRGRACSQVASAPACVDPLNACAWLRAGRGLDGRLGRNSEDDSAVPVAVRAPAGVTAWAQLSAGYGHTCGLSNATMSLWCWGA